MELVLKAIESELRSKEMTIEILRKKNSELEEENALLKNKLDEIAGDEEAKAEEEDDF